MPQRKTAVKDLKKNRARQMRNLDIKSDLRKTIKSFVATAATDAAAAQKLLATLYKKIDKASKRNILNKKTASRRKSKFARLLTAKKA
ncbi:MAG: 30S ribosomal protein S20 [Candidatus Omnitrophica bacterium]|nr:30S ribosomal protein S20 [Candidatus Omnitrophota bacterium]